MPVGQVSNPQMKDILDSEFQRSSDPSFMHRILVSKYLNMPGLRGFWGPSYRNDTAYAGAPYWTDMSGNGYHIPTVGGVAGQSAQLGRAIYTFSGANYGALADNAHFDVTAAEAWIATKGIAMGGWFYDIRVRPHAIIQTIIGKWAGDQCSYILNLQPGGSLQAGISSNGANYYLFNHNAVSALNKWYFSAFTYNPAAVDNEPAGVRVWLNDVMEYHPTSDAGTVGLPAAIFNSTAPLSIASANGAVYIFYGYQTNWWICGNYVLEGDIFNLYETTKYLFGFMNEKGTAW